MYNTRYDRPVGLSTEQYQREQKRETQYADLHEMQYMNKLLSLNISNTFEQSGWTERHTDESSVTSGIELEDTSTAVSRGVESGSSDNNSFMRYCSAFHSLTHISSPEEKVGVLLLLTVALSPLLVHHKEIITTFSFTDVPDSILTGIMAVLIITPLLSLLGAACIWHKNRHN